MQKKKNILWIDWWTKYIWIAYINVLANNMIMPIWYLMNDPSLMFNLWDIIQRYNIWKIVVWYPKDEKIRKKVDEFINQLSYVAFDIPIERIDEEYSSVQAGALKWDFKKDEKEDTLAAMKILENYLQNLQNS